MADLASVKPSDTPPAEPPRKTNWWPSRKAIAGGIGGIVASTIAVVASKYGFTIPPDYLPYIATAIMGLIFYLVPSAQQDIIRNLDNKIVAMAVNDPDSPVTQNKIAAAVRAEPIPTLSPNDPRL